MAPTARSPNAIGSQVVLGPVGSVPEFAATGPDGIPGKARRLGHQTGAAPSQGFGLTSGPLATQSLGHQGMELTVFGPYSFYSQGLIHTIHECKFHADGKLNGQFIS